MGVHAGDRQPCQKRVSVLAVEFACMHSDGHLKTLRLNRIYGGGPSEYRASSSMHRKINIQYSMRKHRK
jgi:hypothetical protein